MTMGKIQIEDLDLYYGDFHALKNINLDIPKQIRSQHFIGPSVDVVSLHF